MNPKLTNNSRYQVVEILWLCFPDPNKANTSGQALSHVFNLQLQTIESSQKALTKNICFGVFRNYYSLKALVEKQLNKPMRNKDRDILFLLLAASYELLFLNTPEHAVISEFVDICQLRGKKWAKGLTNAILRNIQRSTLNSTNYKKTLLTQQLKQKNKSQSTSIAEIKSEHPTWLIKRLEKQWGDRSKSLLNENNLHPPMTLRINKNFCSRADYLTLLEQNNLSAQASENTPFCIYLEHPVDVLKLPHFSEGWVSIQDEAAQQAAYLLDLKPSMKVLDACSAPGGKAGHILELENTVQLTCLDNNQKRLSRVSDNLSRLALQARCIHANAADTQAWWDKTTFDRILLDAPCSATGIIRRNPDIKIQRTQADVSRLAIQQIKLLEHLWHCLAQGGLFVYATCSIMKDENESIIEHFLATQENAELEPITLSFGEHRPFGHQIFPSENGPDGFFYAALRKR